MSNNCKCDFDRDYWHPCVPFWGWTAYTPIIPTLYYDCESVEQSNKNLWKCFDKLSHYADYLAENINKYSPVELEERVTALESDELHPENIYKDKYIFFFGDSYTQGYALTDQTKRFSTLLSNKLRAIERNYYINGTGWNYKHADNSVRNFYEQIIYVNNIITQDEKDNTRLVVISGGINDALGVNTYTYEQEYTAVVNAITAAKQIFPNAKILVVPMLYRGFKFTEYAYMLYTAIVNAVHECELTNVFTIEGCYTWCFGDSTCYNTDKLHPSVKGHNIIYTNILKAVFGMYELWEDKEYYIAFAEGITTAPNASYSSPQTSQALRIKKGIVYTGPYRIVTENGNNSNISAGTIPNCCTPENTCAGIALGGSTILGSWYVTFDAQLGLSCYMSAAAANQRFNCSPIVYPLYGRDYNV